MYVSKNKYFKIPLTTFMEHDVTNTYYTYTIFALSIFASILKVYCVLYTWNDQYYFCLMCNIC